MQNIPRRVENALAKFRSGKTKEGQALTEAEQKEITRAETVALDKKKVSGDRLTVDCYSNTRKNTERLIAQAGEATNGSSEKSSCRRR